MPDLGLQALRTRAWQRLLAGAGPGSLPAWVAPHCACVEALAAAMCDCAERQGLGVDRAVVQAGALLHDLGRSVTQDVRHAGIGADMLRGDQQRGARWPEAVVLCVERHTGAGIDAVEARTLGLHAKDYTPRTLEEKIVAHADNLYSGPRRLGLEEIRAKYEAKGLPGAWRKIEALHRELNVTLGADLASLEPAPLQAP